MQDRGLAAYIAELVGTLLLTFFITSVIVLYVAAGQSAQFGSDFAVVGLVHAFVLAVLIFMLGAVSGGHFNPAVTFGAALLRKIDPVDAVVYILAQLSGGVLGALLTKGLLLDEGRATDYGAVAVGPLVGGDFQGMLIEGIGTFVLVLAFMSLVLNERARKEWAPLGIGLTLGFVVMVLGPLTGAAVNPARWFGPALVGNEFSAVWPFLVGPALGAVLAAGFYWLVIDAGNGAAAGTATAAKPTQPAGPATGGPTPGGSPATGGPTTGSGPSTGSPTPRGPQEPPPPPGGGGLLGG